MDTFHQQNNEQNQGNPQEMPEIHHVNMARNRNLVNSFHSLDEERNAIFWLYYLYLHTERALGADPNKAGSIHHYRCSDRFYNSRMSHDMFKRRAKQVAPLAVQFYHLRLFPPGNIPLFLVPFDGGRRPDVVNLQTLRWVRNPSDPTADELWQN